MGLCAPRGRCASLARRTAPAALVACLAACTGVGGESEVAPPDGGNAAGPGAGRLRTVPGWIADPFGAADGGLAPGAGVIDRVGVEPAEMDPGGFATVVVEFRAPGTDALVDVRVRAAAHGPGGGTLGADSAPATTLPGATGVVRLSLGPLAVEGAWTFSASLFGPHGELLDGERWAGTTVTVRTPCDRSCVCGWFKPSCWASHAGYSYYEWYWMCFENTCPYCGRHTLQYFRSSALDGLPREAPDPMPEHFIRCWTAIGGCDTDYCGICGREHVVGSPLRLRPCARPCPPE